MTIRFAVRLGCVAAGMLLLRFGTVSTAVGQAPPDIQLSVPEAMPASRFMMPGHDAPGLSPRAAMESGPQRISLTGHYAGDVREQILSAGIPPVASPASSLCPQAEPQPLRGPIARRLPPAAARGLTSPAAPPTATLPQHAAIVQIGASHVRSSELSGAGGVVPAFYTTSTDSQASATQLRAAMELRSENAALAVHHLHFCSEVTSYGMFTEIDQRRLRPGRPVLLYAEIESFKSTETPRGHHTALRASYQIVDGQGRTIEQRPLGIVEEHCRNRRRDYFVCYQLTLPSKLLPGRYSLHLAVDDLEGNKSGAAMLDFAIE